jgi:hypothetical protein
MRFANTGGSGIIENVDNNIVIPSGNVGIGEGNPSSKLHVDNGGSGDLLNLTGQLGSITSNKYGNALSFSRPDSNYISATGSGANLQISAATFLRLETNGTEAMRIGDSGRVDITGSLYVNGSEVGSGGGGLPDGDYTHNGKITATDFIATSDERLKDNITPMPVGLIDDIEPVSWEWKDGSGPSAGVVAQQLQSVGLGDYVHENEDGQLGVNYQALTAILLAEVIALKKAIK